MLTNVAKGTRITFAHQLKMVTGTVTHRETAGKLNVKLDNGREASVRESAKTVRVAS